MSERARFRPFTGDAERRVQMPDAPLALVLVQIRWPEHGRFAREFTPFALDFGEQLSDFPLHDEITETGIQITPEGVKEVAGEVSHQWKSVDDVWTVHLNKRALSLFCVQHKDYSFSEFQTRLADVAGLLGSSLQIRSFDRVGMRYVNRVSSPDVLNDLGASFRTEALGHSTLVLREGVHLLSNISQAMYQVEDVLLQTRSGALAPGQTVDAAVAPLDRPSWLLDIDASIEARSIYDPELVQSRVGRLADTAYDFFKWMLVDGGEQALDGSA